MIDLGADKLIAVAHIHYAEPRAMPKSDEYWPRNP